MRPGLDMLVWQLWALPDVVAAEQAPSRILRHAMWVPTRDDEQAVSTAPSTYCHGIEEHTRHHCSITL